MKWLRYRGTLGGHKGDRCIHVINLIKQNNLAFNAYICPPWSVD